MLREKRHGRATAGVTAIEFAILLPFFIMLVFGIMAFAQVVFIQIEMQRSVTQAARCASFYSGGSCNSCTAIITYAVNAELGFPIPSSDYSVTTPVTALQGTGCTAPSPSANFNCVTVTLNNYAVYIPIPLVPNFNIPLEASSCYPTVASSTQ